MISLTTTTNPILRIDHHNLVAIIATVRLMEKGEVPMIVAKTGDGREKVVTRANVIRGEIRKEP
jgi:hypothetical protein